MPICIRKKGLIEELLNGYGASASVVSRFQCLYPKRPRAMHYELDVPATCRKSCTRIRI